MIMRSWIIPSSTSPVTMVTLWNELTLYGLSSIAGIE